MTLYAYTYTFPYRFTVNEVLPSTATPKPQPEAQKAEQMTKRKPTAVIESVQYRCSFCKSKFAIETSASPTYCPVCGIKY
jgi:rubrerythrin